MTEEFILNSWFYAALPIAFLFLILEKITDDEITFGDIIISIILWFLGYLTLIVIIIGLVFILIGKLWDKKII